MEAMLYEVMQVYTFLFDFFVMTLDFYISQEVKKILLLILVQHLVVC